MANIQNHLKILVQLAVADDHYSKSEDIMIMVIGKANGVPQEEIQRIIDEGMTAREKHNEPMDFSTLSFDEKFEYLYDIVQLMKIDHEIFLSEIKYCEGIAEKLGFKKSVISQMSQRIYSDPTITSDRDKLKNLVKGFIN